ncbi:MAG: murein DD-endopeptidase MepM/ murein hydrolase activator NlpD [Paraglaciecola sp.]|jgi:murein DD-endopeptidase MepM/ murein hydrolase activator NlpD
MMRAKGSSTSVSPAIYLHVSLLLWFLGYSAEMSAQQSDFCAEYWVCINTKEQNGSTEFWLSNDAFYPITATLEIAAKDLLNDKNTSNLHAQTIVVKGQTQSLALKLNVANANKRTNYSTTLEWTAGNMHALHDDDFRYHLPYAKNEYYPIVQGFGGGYSHQGASKYAVDFAMPIGTPVYAARGGQVIRVVEKHNKGGASRRFAKYANYVAILHSDETSGEYYHLKQYAVVVEAGDKVVAGQHIGYSGNTGFSSLPHLHFAVYRAKSHGEFESIPFEFNQ